jgi:hypothetical protein
VTIFAPPPTITTTTTVMIEAGMCQCQLVSVYILCGTNLVAVGDVLSMAVQLKLTTTKKRKLFRSWVFFAPKVCVFFSNSLG